MDLTSLNNFSSINSRLDSIINDISLVWKGESGNSFVSNYEKLKNELFEAIQKQLNIIKDVCKLIEKYLNTKEQLENYQRSYEIETQKEDNTSANYYLQKINECQRIINQLKPEINSKIDEIKSLKINAEGLDNVDLSSSSFIGFNGYTLDNYPLGNSHEDAVARAILVAQYLMQNGGFSMIQASAIVGVSIDENGCHPGTVMQAEKDGLGASGTGGNGYGAGIGSWTMEDYKNQCLMDAGYPAGTQIESLSLKEQCDIIIATSKKSMGSYYDALRRCDNITDASATAQLLTEGIGYSNNWDTHPTTEDAKNASDIYANWNDNYFGYSPYHHGMYERRIEYANEILNLLK